MNPASLLAAYALARREVVRFLRQRNRVFGALAQPVLFWAIFGAGLSPSFRTGSVGYSEYFFPGVIVMILLFTAIFATISIIDDRNTGFLQGVLVAPVPRQSIVLGQALGCTTLGVVQGVILLPLAPLVGIPLTAAAAVQVVGVMVLVAFGLTSLSLVIAWRLDSTQGFHAIMNLLLLPMWLLSGAFFPATGAPIWLLWAMQVNPLTYGLAAIRRCLYLGNPAGAGAVPALGPSLAVVLVFGGLAFAAAVHAAMRKRA